jgi:hypothetical protein
MSNSSVVILSSKSSSKDLEIAFEDMIDVAESELWVSVEFIHGSNSFWASTPEEEMYDHEVIGIIDIGDDQETINKIVALAHEVGHCLHHKHQQFNPVRDVMFSESIAWFLGYNWFFDRRIVINMAEYQNHMVKALEMYRMEL